MTKDNILFSFKKLASGWCRVIKGPIAIQDIKGGYKLLMKPTRLAPVIKIIELPDRDSRMILNEPIIFEKGTYFRWQEI
jgi:hypothetical protein